MISWTCGSDVICCMSPPLMLKSRLGPGVVVDVDECFTEDDDILCRKAVRR